MKRYLVFVYDQYYPRSRRTDFAGDADTIEDALLIVVEAKRDHWHIVDTTARRIVKPHDLTTLPLKR